MYRIYADDTLIYDSTLEDYKIGKGQITREADKSGSFVFSVYPDHPYYGQFVQMRTVITVYKSGRIVFRGRILDDATDYWNVKTLTCEGELGFLQDSVARPFSFQGDHADLFAQFIAEHNDQVDDWKKFKVGTVTVEDSNEYINRSAGGYGAMLDTMQSALTGSELGGHFYITHGDDGTDPIPTLHYVADFPKTAAQGIEFGVNLKDYTKKVSAADLATCIIPLGASTGSDGERLTIEAKNGGKDYIYDANAVAMYGWIVKVVTWDDVTLDNHLLTKGRAWLAAAVNQHATIELSAIDMHLLDRSIESYNACEYVRATSKPHGLDALMLCSKQTMDLLKPDNDTVTLGYTTGTLTGANVQLGASVSTLGKSVSRIQQDAASIELSVQDLSQNMGQFLRIGADGVTITNAAGSALTIDGGQINAETLEVNAANVTGKLTAANVEIEAAAIAGTLTIGNMPSGVATTDDIPTAVSDLTNDKGYQTKSQVTTITNDAISTASISADQITTGTLDAGNIELDGWLALVKGSRECGYFGATYTVANGAGATMAGPGNGAGYVRASGEGAKVAIGDYEIGVYESGSDGGCYSTHTISVNSDRRLKKNISYDLEQEEKLFSLLRACSFEMNNDDTGKKHWGFIAQDVIAGAGEAGMDPDKLAVIGSRAGMYSIAYGELTALNTHMIQKLMARVDELEARVARLEAEKNG